MQTAVAESAVIHRIGQAIVVRHCQGRHLGKNYDMWPGDEIYLFDVNPDNPDEYRYGAKDGRPVFFVPRNAVLTFKPENPAQYEIYSIQEYAYVFTPFVELYHPIPTDTDLETQS
jgi:hypothetical protein